MIANLSRLTGEILTLLKACEFEKALQRSMEARCQVRTETLEARQLAVREVTLAIVEIRRMREQILRLADAQPEIEKMYTREKLERICRELYDSELAALHTKKRAYSRPSN